MRRMLGDRCDSRPCPRGALLLGDLTYDRASNLASWKLQSGTSATAVTAKHDAWNRLTEVSFGGTLRCRQAHNALHWRSFQLSDRTGTGSGAGAGPDGTMDQARLMSYGADWRLLEERVDDNLSLSAWTEGTWSPGTDLDRVQQYVWGTRYVDDIVLHRVDANIDGDYSDAVDNAWHHLTDAQFSSVCLVDKAFNVAERVSYSAYGVARHLPMADINCDGAVNGADIGALFGAFGSIGSSPYQSPADLNRDGVVNSADLAMLLGDFQAAQPDGALSRPNVDNPIGWDGYVFDRESGLYTVRFRTYETSLGRWIQRDPAGYQRSPSLFVYVSSAPPVATDAYGLQDSRPGRVPGRFAVAGGSFSDALRPPSCVQPTCGPDVTEQLKAVLAKLAAKFASWTPAQQQAACNSFTDGSLDPLRNPSNPQPTYMNAWDIGELHNFGGNQWIAQPPYYPTCSSPPPCDRTVEVNGQCSYSGSVNYVLFGVMWKLCGKQQWTMDRLIWGWKGYVPFYRSAAGNYEKSVEWADAGYNGWPVVAGTPAGDRPQCAHCPIKYQGAPFTFYWATRGWY